MKELKGIGASPGIAIGRAFPSLEEDGGIPHYSIERSQVDGELERFAVAIRKATQEVTLLRDKAEQEAGSEQSAIFETHLLMLSDPDLQDQVTANINATLKNIEWIIWQHEQKLVKKLQESNDQYMRERTDDIHDVSRRVLNHLLFRDHIDLSRITEQVILVAHDIMPSDAVSLDKRFILGIAMDSGGKTSHTAILARAFEIPAVLGLGDITKTIKPGELVIVSGDEGFVIIDPDPITENKYRKLRKKEMERDAVLALLATRKAVTKDGKSYSLKANIEIPGEVETALRHGAEGIGLYRSEFLFLTGRHATEEEQFTAYSSVLKDMGDRPVTIRTLDLGGDKMIPELEAQEEKNPLLGWRAIRFCLSRKDIFSSQLRALLRASVLGNLKIMFPMISGPEEIDLALELLEEAKTDLKAKDIPYAEGIQVGIMIEIPSAALMADILARKVDFFSIGTNDLIQYTLAVDRGNEKTAYLYQPFHPGVLRLVKSVIAAAKAEGIPCSMCGEMAGDPRATPLLMGMGLEEFSMSSQSVPVVKDLIQMVNYEEAAALAREVMGMSSHREIDAKVNAFMKALAPERSV